MNAAEYEVSMASSTSTEVATATIANLPSNSEALKSLSHSQSAQASSIKNTTGTNALNVNQLCVVVWLNKN